VHTTVFTNSLLKWLSAICCMAVVYFPSAIYAAGSETVRGSDTVRLTVDSRWPGNAHGGYVPFRIKLTNLGPAQDFQLVFKDENANDRIPEVRRMVHLDQNATRDFTLPIPIVSLQNNGTLFVMDGRGNEIEELKTVHTLPEYGGDNARASMLVISADDVDEKGMEAFEDAAATECASLRGLLGATSRYGPTQILDRDHLSVPPVNLPENWTDYSGIDFVAISWTNLYSKLKTTEREAILRWAACGGVLIIYGTEKPAAEMDALHQLLKLDQMPAKRWTTVDLPFVDTKMTSAKTLKLATVGIGGRGHSAGRIGAPGMPTTAVAIPEEPRQVYGENMWLAASNAPTYRDWSFGRIYVFPKNPFPGVSNDWAWLLSSLPQNQSRWSSRLGMSSRTTNPEFLNFLIPGVGSVPVHAFLVLITIFTVIIGPLNYYWLRKNRKLGALVFTVPLVASIACIMLFVYSLLADGFSIRSRVQSITFLDQEAKSAASISRVCYYAPFAPSTGLRFAPGVAAFPIWPIQKGFEGGVVDWSENEQHLTSGWFRSQTWTQFLLVEQRDERGRLDFIPPDDPMASELTISNGLSWELTYLAIEASPGNWYAGSEIPAGASAKLKRMSPTEIGLKFSNFYTPNAWKPPEGLENDGVVRGRGFSSGHFAFGRGVMFSGTTALSDGQLRRYQNGASMPADSPVVTQHDWRNGQFRRVNARHTEAVRPHFWAISAQNPGVDIGVQNTLDKDSYHVLFGEL
jgi:hypothetical protein